MRLIMKEFSSSQSLLQITLLFLKELAFILSFFPEEVFPFPLFAAGNYIIHKARDCTVLIEVNANRRRLLEGRRESISCGIKLLISFNRCTICLSLHYS